MNAPHLPRAFCAVAASLLAAGLVTPTGISAQASAAEPKNQAPLAFDQQIAPLLASRCGECHGEHVREASLDLRSKSAILKGGDSGPSLVPGSAEKSLLFAKIIAGEMPPEDHPKLKAEQVDLIRRWIDTGAHGGMAEPPLDAARLAEPVANFQPLRQVSPPAVREPQRAKTPIDLFLLQKLDAAGLTFSPPADKVTLLRRLSLDLTGLPPRAAEIDAFLADDSPQALDRVLDRLLESPQFGERWGRHWLDAAGYSDVYGTDNDAAIIKLGKGKWRYRDYVIQSLNEDKPYRDFLTEQLAGDELIDWRGEPKRTPEAQRLLVATGLLCTNCDNTDERELRTLPAMHLILQEAGEVLASNVLGLTLRCAKCHNHKYEPITQADYYSFLALLAPVYNPEHWMSPLERALPDMSAADKATLDKQNAAIDADIAKQQQRQSEVEKSTRVRLYTERLLKLPAAIRDDLTAALDKPAAARGPVEKYLVEKFEKDVHVRPAEVKAALAPAEKQSTEAIDRQIAELTSHRRQWGVVHAVYDVAPPPVVHLLRRGQVETPGAEVPPRFLSVFGGQLPVDVRPVGPTSGRRLALAHLLTDWKSPAGGLVARVMVNRVWQHLLGRGIIETTDNLGRSGTPASHPELLEWLSSEYVARGTRLKPLIRLIVSSAAYQQTARVDRSPAAARAEAVDPDNHLWWRMPLRRLEAEAVRDSILAASGKLDMRMGGPAVWIIPRHDGVYVFEKEKLLSPTDPLRRSVYFLARRNYHPPILNVFDQPLMATNAPLRQTSSVVLQSLTMLNDPFVVEQAEAFASRLEHQAGSSATPADRVKLAFRIALSRQPTAEEVTASTALLARHEAQYRQLGQAPAAAAQKSLVQLCRMVLNTSEFLYIP